MPLKKGYLRVKWGDDPTIRTGPQQSINGAPRNFEQRHRIDPTGNLCGIDPSGFAINQSKISRMLHKLAAIKVKNAHGQTGYRLSKELAPPPSQTPLKQLILKIAANENLVIIQTSPGSASLIARMLDFQNSESEILATLAGDDTIFVAPKSVRRMDKTYDEVKKLLAGIEPGQENQ